MPDVDVYFSGSGAPPARGQERFAVDAANQVLREADRRRPVQKTSTSYITGGGGSPNPARCHHDHGAGQHPASGDVPAASSTAFSPTGSSGVSSGTRAVRPRSPRTRRPTEGNGIHRQHRILLVVSLACVGKAWGKAWAETVFPRIKSEAVGQFVMPADPYPSGGDHDHAGVPLYSPPSFATGVP